MKKYIALIALVAATGCGAGDKEDITSTTETTTEFTTEAYEEESRGEESTEKETEAVEVESLTEVKNDNGEDVAESENFEDSQAYGQLEALASNAGFDISCNGNTVTFKTYITDDTIDYINEKDAEYYNKWDENCGLYEEFCSEAVRTVKNSGVTDVNVTLEVIGRSDNQVYFKNENGATTYNGYEN